MGLLGFRAEGMDALMSGFLCRRALPKLASNHPNDRIKVPEYLITPKKINKYIYIYIAEKERH